MKRDFSPAPAARFVPNFSRKGAKAQRTPRKREEEGMKEEGTGSCKQVNLESITLRTQRTTPFLPLCALCAFAFFAR